jgi:hypothetical protein
MGFIPTIGPFGLLTTDTAYVLRASDTLRLDSDNVIRLGLEYRNNAGTGISQSGTIGYQVYAASAMWDWQITPALSFTNAVRADYLALNYSGQLLPGSPFTTSEYNNDYTAVSCRERQFRASCAGGSGFAAFAAAGGLEPGAWL